MQRLLPVPGGKVWCRHDGGPDDATVVALHGGPGCPSDYLFALQRLTPDYGVVWYDQLGCGRSELGTAADYRLQRYLDELEAVLDGLGLARVALLGHSWGAMLAVDAALRWPHRFTGLILWSPCLSMARTRADMARLVATLPPAVRDVLTTHERQGATDHPAYQAAALVFYQRYLCRLTPWPAALRLAQQHWGTDAYRTMWGPAEFRPSGNLADYEREPELPNLRVPALLLCGRHDEITPAATAHYASLIPGARLRVFPDSAHLALLEEPDAFLAAVTGFLKDLPWS